MPLGAPYGQAKGRSETCPRHRPRPRNDQLKPWNRHHGNISRSIILHQFVSEPVQETQVDDEEPVVTFEITEVAMKRDHRLSIVLVETPQRQVTPSRSVARLGSLGGATRADPCASASFRSWI